jgi:nucleotide-binding universal stress UspA family protein
MSNEFRILVAVDLKVGTDQLVAEAQRYGQALQAVVDIIHVAPPDPDFVGYIKGDRFEDKTREDVATAFRSEHRQAQAIKATLQAANVRTGEALMVQGPIVETILEHVRVLNTNLLVLGSHHHGALFRFWYGDTAEDTARRSPCAVLVVPVE